MYAVTEPAPPPADGSNPFSRRIGWLFAAVWLFFLSQPFGVAWRHPHGLARDVALVSLIAFGALYVASFVFGRHVRRGEARISTWQAIAILGGLLALGLATIPAAGRSWMATLVYVAAAAMFLLPLRPALLVVAAVVAIPLLSPLVVPSWESETSVAFAVLLAAFAIYGVSRLATRNAELLAAQAEIRRLAVAEERARAARDLHDILGHSLTVIAVKAELAGRLLEIDPGRAAGEVSDLERLAREALSDVRQTVGAYRELSLAAELASARSALAAAGIEAELPGVDDEVPAANRELFGWAVREGVTNVVRHSGARRCVIRVGADRVEVADDGRGPVETAGVTGHGLRGLRERADQVGGQLTVGRSEGGKGFLLRVSVPPTKGRR